MKMLVTTEGEDGVSFFEERDVPMRTGDFAPPAPPMLVSQEAPAATLLFLELPPGWTGARHPSPRVQIAACLSGVMRVTTGDGASRDVTPGSVWLMLDTGGQGHESAVVGDEPVRLAVTQLDEG